MASEVEDCSSFEHLQADCLPTGSISFGRFEAESLTWERRSSFSHNRYLEEVEKYSTPGSVIKKKAYFEAHFKKTALRNLDSIGRQNETDGQSENDMEDQVHCLKEFRDHHGNGELQFEDLEGRENFGIQFSWYDETPDASDEEQHEIMETEKNKATSSSELTVEVPNSNDGSCVAASKTDFQLVQCGGAIENVSGSEMTEPVEQGGDVIVEEKSENKVVNVNAEEMNMSAKNSAVNNVHASSLKKASKASLTAKKTMEQKSRRVKSRTEVPAVQTKTKISAANIHLSLGMSSAKVSNKSETGTPVRLKQSSSRISPSTSSGTQNLKSEDSDKRKVNVTAESRSSFNGNKGDKAKGVLVPPSNSHQQGQVDGRKSVNRDKRVTNTMKLGSRMSGTLFSFKSDERAEKRKEYYTKLEKKQHTKEVELNEIQARKQEETEAEIKQLRKSLNFKATPMPSFYQEGGTKVLDGKKATNGSAKPLKLPSKCTSPASRGVTRANSTSVSKSPHRQGPSTSSEHRRTTQECITKSQGDNCCATAPNGAGKGEAAAMFQQASEPDKKIDAAKKEDRTKANLQQKQGTSKVKKRDGVSGVRRSNVGKVIKGMSSGSMAVRVAS